MKKLIVLVAVVLAVLTLSSCTRSSNAKIPMERVSYIAFYNGGECIYEAEGIIEVKAVKYEKVGWTDEYWLVYEIYFNNELTRIIDSDALAILWR